MTTPDPSSLVMIYETFLKGHFKRFKPQINELSIPLIKTAIALHDKV